MKNERSKKTLVTGGAVKSKQKISSIEGKMMKKVVTPKTVQAKKKKSDAPLVPALYDKPDAYYLHYRD